MPNPNPCSLFPFPYSLLFLSSSNTRRVPNQNTFSKLLIREELHLQFPQFLPFPVSTQSSQNETTPPRPISLILFLSVSYSRLPVLTLQIQKFPSWNRKDREQGNQNPCRQGATEQEIWHWQENRRMIGVSVHCFSGPLVPRSSFPRFLVPLFPSVLSLKSAYKIVRQNQGSGRRSYARRRALGL